MTGRAPALKAAVSDSVNCGLRHNSLTMWPDLLCNTHTPGNFGQCSPIIRLLTPLLALKGFLVAQFPTSHFRAPDIRKEYVSFSVVYLCVRLRLHPH